MGKLSFRSKRAIVLLVVLGALYFTQEGENSGEQAIAQQSSQPVSSASKSRAADQAIVAAFKAGRSDVIVEGEGSVEKVLPDDNKGSRHQRFILALDSGHTVLVAHNIDLAPRIPDLRRDDRIQFKGEYEWNERGGVIHWTHRDPRGRHPHGWLYHGNQKYE